MLILGSALLKSVDVMEGKEYEMVPMLPINLEAGSSSNSSSDEDLDESIDRLFHSVRERRAEAKRRRRLAFAVVGLVLLVVIALFVVVFMLGRVKFVSS